MLLSFCKGRLKAAGGGRTVVLEPVLRPGLARRVPEKWIYGLGPLNLMSRAFNNKIPTHTNIGPGFHIE